MLEGIFWTVLIIVPTVLTAYAVTKRHNAKLRMTAAEEGRRNTPAFQVAVSSVIIGVGGLILLVVGAWVFSFHVVTGGQVGVAMKGGNVDTFTGFKITTLGTKVVTIDRAIPLDLNVEFDGNGAPSARTVILTPKDGSQVFLDARAVLALDSACADNPLRRCLTADDKAKIGGLAVQFRKGGQGALESYATAKLRERANLTAGTYSTADDMINQQRAAFLDAFQKDVTDRLAEIGMRPTLLVVEQLVPSQATLERLNDIAKERATTNLRTQAVKTAEQDALIQKAKVDQEAYDIKARADAEAHRIREQGAAYTANPQAAAVDIARAYGEKGNATVITNGTAEVRPVVTTGGQPAAPAAGG